MKKNQPRLAAYILITLAFTLIAAVLRSIALLTELNLNTGYFDDKRLITAADAMITCAVVFGISYIFTTDRKRRFVASYDGMTTYIPSIIVAVSLIFVTIDIAAALEISEQSSATEQFKRLVGVAGVVSILLAVSTVLAFVLTVISTKKSDVKRAAFQIGATLFFAVYAAYIYFDNSLPINTPNRIVDICAYLFTSAFFIYETRISLGRDIRFAYSAFGLIAMATTAYSAIPSLITYFASGVVISHSISESLVTLALLIFISLRLVGSLYLFEEKETGIVLSIMDAEKKKAEELALAQAEASEVESDEEQSDEENENYTIELDALSEVGEKDPE